MHNRKGFTLTEALVSLAVVGALAVVTAPLYINSDILEKVARQRLNLSEVEKALELYRSEYYNYPPWFFCFDCAPDLSPNIRVPYPWLTTPVEYIPSKDCLTDAFLGETGLRWFRLGGTPGYWTWNESFPPEEYFQDDFQYRTWLFMSCDDFEGLVSEKDSYALYGVGPDGLVIGRGVCEIYSALRDLPYDPSNGIVSRGHVFNFGPRQATPSPVPSATPTPTITPSPTLTPTGRPAGLLLH